MEKPTALAMNLSSIDAHADVDSVQSLVIAPPPPHSRTIKHYAYQPKLPASIFLPLGIHKINPSLLQTKYLP